MNKRKKVKIRGRAILSPLGVNADEVVSSIRSGSLPTTYPETLPLHLKEKVKVSAFDDDCFHRLRDRFDDLVVNVLDQVIRDAGLSESEIASSGFVMGTSGCIIEAERVFLAEKEKGVEHPVPVSIGGAGSMTLNVATQAGIKGPALTITTACTSSANALLTAARLIETGELERVIVVGAEVLNSLTMNGFFSLMLLTKDGCRPFDRDREGMHLGEGVAALVLEACREDEKGFTLAGGANLCDRENVISISKDGSSIASVMKQALSSAAIDAGSIKAVKTHGIGSKDNDLAESLAMKEVFGQDIPPFTSLKGYFGHTLGAAGALELVAFMNCLEKGFLPAAGAFQNLDEAVALSPLTAETEAGAGYYLLNFLGFGGNNASLVLKYE